MFSKAKTANDSGDAVWKELHIIWEIGWPSLITEFLWSFNSTIMVIMVGRMLNTDALAGTSLGFTTVNLAGMSMIYGLISAADTLMPRAYGLGDFAEVGYLMQRSYTVGAGMIIFCAIIWRNIQPLLMFMQQPLEIAVLVQEFCNIYLFGMLAILGIEVMRKFLLAQNITKPIVTIMIGGTLCIIPVNYVCITRWGFRGAIIGFCCIEWILMLLMMAFIVIKHPHHKNTLPRFTMRSAADLPKLYEYLSYGLPGMVMSGVESWAFEMNCFIVGFLGKYELAAYTVAFGISPLIQMMGYGLGSGISTRIGVILARGEPELARKVAWKAAKYFGLLVLTLTFLLYALRDSVVAMYTSDPHVVGPVRDIWALVCLFTISSGAYPIANTVVRGLGAQKPASCISCCVLWFGMLPSSYYAQKFGYGQTGVWISMIVFYTLLNLTFLWMIQRMSWSEVSIQIRAKTPKCAEAGTEAGAEAGSMLSEHGDGHSDELALNNEETAPMID